MTRLNLNRLTAEGVAGLLGVRPATVYSYVSRGTLFPGGDCPCCGYGPTWQQTAVEAWRDARPGRTGRPKRV